MEPPTHVFASGPVFGNFLVGKHLATHFHVPLCLQYRDEWTVMKPSFVADSNRDRSDEEDCLSRADLVTFVTRGKADLYRAHFPVLRDKRVLVSPNGWDPLVVSKASPTSEHLAHFQGKVVLTFTGRVTNEIPIGPFLKVLADVLDADTDLRQRLVLHLIGDQNEWTQQELAEFASRQPGVIEVRPGVPQSTAVEIMRESAALLLLNNTRYRGVVPLKTFDYLVSGSPVLAFGDTGEAGEIVRETGAGVTIPEGDPVALRLGLRSLISTPRGDWNGVARKKWCERNNREQLCSVLLSEIDAIPGY
jgi:glycosyltransferase involved in cell wall biosynthesis